MHIDRPKLLEAIRLSILNYKITYIYGMHGVGKSTLCHQCFRKYFSDKEIYTIRSYTSTKTLNAYRFINGIYVFEDFNFSYIDTHITNYIYSIVHNTKAKFVFISTQKFTEERQLIINYMEPFINCIEIQPFGYNEMKKFFRELHDENILNKIFNITKGNVLLAHEIGHFLFSQNNYSNILDIVYTPCIIDKYGNPIEKIDNSTQIIVTDINDKILCKLSKIPVLL